MSKMKQWFNIQLLIGLIIAAAVIAAVLSVIFKDRYTESGGKLSAQYQYNLEQFQKTDPALILYEETDIRFKTELDPSCAIAVDSQDNIYVAGGRSVRVFSSKGKPLPLNIDLDQEATSLTVDPNGRIFAGAGDRIVIFDSSGNLKSRWESAGPDALITSIAVSPDHVFAANFTKREILQYDMSGRKIQTFGEFFLPSPHFDLAYSSDGQLWASHSGEHRIEAYDLSGNLVSWWGEFSTLAEGFCGCCNPVNFALLPHQSGFVTCEKGITRVKIYDAKGTFVGFAAGAEKFAEHDRLCLAPDYDYRRVALDVAADSKGRVLILDPALAEVRIFQRMENQAAGT
ncbi:MAG: hypothetical protein JXR73_08985 [Candidatus Omnitrophica bacterium]|nr:hypothetical protein [Candidatus Omnitrophota bacterium]